MKIGVVGIDTYSIQLASFLSNACEMVLIYDSSEELLKSSILTLRKQLMNRSDQGEVSIHQLEEMLVKFSFVNQLSPFEDCNIVFTNQPKATSADFIGKIERFLTTTTILCPILSDISIHQYTPSLKHPERLIGVRFYPTTEDVKIAEIVPSLYRNEQAVTILKKWLQELGIASICSNDSFGLLVHRMQIPLYDEAIRIVSENVADESTVDRILEKNGFHLGPFSRMDEYGLDKLLDIIEQVFEQTEQDPKYRPPSTLKHRVESQWLGKKTGRGFYKHEVAK